MDRDSSRCLPLTAVGYRRLGCGELAHLPQLQAYLAVQYEFERALGEGGMGAVILARDRALDRKVAIKVLHGGAGSSEDQRGRFRREPSSPHD